MTRRLLVFAALLAFADNAVAQEPVAPPDEKQSQALPGYFEKITVESASRVPEELVSAPATMDVVTSGDIAASSAQSIGDLLRALPGENVVQTSARDFNLTSRQATGVLTNSQLALVDGRSIYLDFFGLVLWDFVPTNPADIKQIEVVRGPASAVWGANALIASIGLGLFYKLLRN